MEICRHGVWIFSGSNGLSLCSTRHQIMMDGQRGVHPKIGGHRSALYHMQAGVRINTKVGIHHSAFDRVSNRGTAQKVGR